MFLYLTLSGRRSDPIITLRKLHMMTMTRKCIVLLSITDPEETEKSLNPDATAAVRTIRGRTVTTMTDLLRLFGRHRNQTIKNK